MPRRKVVVSDASGDPGVQDSDATEGVSMEASARSVAIMDPAVPEVIREVTMNLTKVIEDKLGPVSLFLQAQGKQLEDHETRIKEAEARILTVEDVTAPIQDKLKSLEKRVQELAEHADDLENRGRR